MSRVRRTRCRRRGSRRRRGPRTEGTRSSVLKIDEPLPPIGNPSLIDRLGRAELIEREPADRGVAAGEEPLARRQVADRDERPAGRRVRRSDCPSRRSRDQSRAKPIADPEPRARREHDPLRPRQRRNICAVRYDLSEADLRPDRARRQAAVRAQIVAGARVRADRRGLSRTTEDENDDRRTWGNSRSTSSLSRRLDRARRRARCAESGSCR